MDSVSDSAPENPLVWPLYQLLAQGPKVWKLNELFAALQADGIAVEASLSQQVFKTNFLLMNGLYQLRAILATTHSLAISTLAIRLQPLEEGGDRAVPAPVDPLRDYYLDWSNFDASEEEVAELLQSFWSAYRKRFGTLGDVSRAQALQVFELDEQASVSDIRRRWRKLAFRWHPDREGGDAEAFKRVCAAWQVLNT